jgi:Uma2 family endonuclease
METVLEKPQSVVLHNISWNAYERIADSVQEYTPAHFTFDRGNLEIMVLSSKHESLKKVVGMLFEKLCDALYIDFWAAGSTTFRREDLERGFEPDECYYVANAQSLRGSESIDLDFDPPPDLSIEVDVSNSSLNRLDIFAAVGIPEVWRYDGDRLIIYRLNDGRYETCDLSGVIEGAESVELSELARFGQTNSRREFVNRIERYVESLARHKK